MKCEEIENLLPSFVEGQITKEEKRSIESHLSECAGCRESYKRYIFLEESLSALKETLPSSQAVADSVLKRLNLRKRRFQFARLLNISTVASFFMIVLSLFTFFNHNRIFRFTAFCVENITPLLTSYSENLFAWLTRISAGYFWPAFTIFILLNLLIILSGGMFALRYVRE
jgi:hypothetical protein